MTLAGLQYFSRLPGCQFLEHISFLLHHLLPWVFVKVPILCRTAVSVVALVLAIWLWHKLAQQIWFSEKTVFEQDYSTLNLVGCCNRREGVSMDIGSLTLQNVFCCLNSPFCHAITLWVVVWVRCVLKLPCSFKFSNSAHENWGPLYETSLSGTPCRGN